MALLHEKAEEAHRQVEVVESLCEGAFEAVLAGDAATHDRLLLVTYRVPGMINVRFSERSAAQLRSTFGDKVEHRIIDIRGFVHEVRGGALRCVTDNLHYGFYYSWCLGCKLSMHLTTIDVCRRRGIVPACGRARR